MHDPWRRWSFKGQPARHQRVGHDPQRVLIGGRGQPLAPPLLRGHVAPRADDRSRPRQAARGVQQLGDAEVHHEGIAVIVEHHVRRLDVAVDHALVVGVVQRTPHLAQQTGDFAQRWQELAGAGALCHALGQRAAGQQPHNQVADVLLRAIVEDGDDVGMFERGGSLRLTGEALDVAGLLGQSSGHHLDGDVPLEAALIGAIDGPHAAHAQQFAQFVLT